MSVLHIQDPSEAPTSIGIITGKRAPDLRLMIADNWHANELPDYCELT